MRRNWKRKTTKPSARRENMLILAVISVAVTPAIVAVAMIAASSRLDFFYTDFNGFSADGSATVIGWPSLRSRSALLIRANTTVELPGYMLPFGSAQYGESVSCFLLVPDPGIWLHPPHIDQDEVVMVRMQAGKSASLLERQAVWVRGSISETPAKKDTDIVYHMNAEKVWVSGRGSP